MSKLNSSTRNFIKFKSKIVYPAECYACKRHFNQICVHHKDGDRKNDYKTNFILLCINCHWVVHNGLAKRFLGNKNRLVKRNYMFEYCYKPEVIQRLSRLREFLLVSTGKKIIPIQNRLGKQSGWDRYLENLSVDDILNYPSEDSIII